MDTLTRFHAVDQQKKISRRVRGCLDARRLHGPAPGTGNGSSRD